MNNNPSIQWKKLVPWIIYLIFFAVLNETVFNVSTPKISAQFNLTPSGVSWMMTIFLVFFGIGSIIYGRLSDIFSLRLLLLIGIVLYNIGSVMGFMVQSNYPLVIAARAIQGMGASALPALVFVLVARYIPAQERGKIFGSITSFVSIGIGIGPMIGGFVSDTLNWSYLFLIPLLIFISVPFLIKILPSEPRKQGGLDVFGAVLVSLLVGFFVLFLNYSNWYFLAAFICLLAGFLIWINSVKDPFIKPSLFKNIQFRNGVIIGFGMFSIVIGIMFLIPIMLHAIHSLTPSQIALIVFPGAISSVVFGPIAGNVADRKGNNTAYKIGITLLIASMLLISFLLSFSVLFITVALFLTYVGFSFAQIAMINTVSLTLPSHETGVGMGLFNLVTIVSGAVGTALVGKLLDGKLLNFSLLPYASLPASYAYTNLLFLFSIIIILGGILFLYTYRKPVVVSSENRANIGH